MPTNVYNFAAEPYYKAPNMSNPYSTVHDSPTGISPDVTILGQFESFGDYYVSRGFIWFDTSDLAGKTIISAILEIEGTQPEFTAGDGRIYAIAAEFSMPPINSDYGLLHDLPQVGEGDTRIPVLIVVDPSAIVADGFTRFGLRVGDEYDGVFSGDRTYHPNSATLTIEYSDASAGYHSQSHAFSRKLWGRGDAAAQHVDPS